MKRLFALMLALLMLVPVASCVAEGTEEAGERVLREGKYIIGEDIAAGTYTLTCTTTAGEQMSDAYGSLGSAFDALDGGNEFGSLFGMLGGMMENYVDLTVEIIGDYGDVLRTYTLKTGDSMSITLKEETALQITDGSCTIVAEESPFNAGQGR